MTSHWAHSRALTLATPMLLVHAQSMQGFWRRALEKFRPPGLEWEFLAFNHGRIFQRTRKDPPYLAVRVQEPLLCLGIKQTLWAFFGCLNPPSLFCPPFCIGLWHCPFPLL